MRRFLLLFLMSASAVFAQNSYSTNFPLVENPLSQGGIWIQGGIAGFTNIAITAANKATSTQTTGSGFTDATAVLTGNWGPNQVVTATFHTTNSIEENELRTNTTIVSGGSIFGYEFNCSSGYVELVRWDGGHPLSFTVLIHDGAHGCHDGDAIKASNDSSGHLKFFINGTQTTTFTDTTYQSGSPGMGMNTFLLGGGVNSDHWLSDFTATDIAATAGTCNRADVNAVINGPTHTAINGEIIQVPAGSCTWTSGVTIAGVGISIVGVGTPNNLPSQFGAGSTSTTLINHANAPFFTFTGLTNGQTARVGIFSMSASGGGANSTIGAISLSGTCNSTGCPQARVDNINFVSGWYGISQSALILEDGIFGVVDHTTSNEPSASAFFLVQVSNSAWKGVGAFGDNSFASASTVGTNQAFFIENNSASNVRLTDNDVGPTGGAVGGARYVCRFNSIPLMQGDGVCGAHGTAWGGRFRGQRQLEVYYNTISATICNDINGLNSGSGFFLSNTLTGTGCNRSLTLEIPRFIQTSSPWNSCDGTQPWDKVPFSSSSPCLDQPGSGAGSLYQGTTPVLASAPGTPCTTAGQCWPNPALDPVYEAGEVTPNNAPGVFVATDGSSTRVLANRDYYGQVSDVAQTSATSPFNGTTGTGYGTLARRPTTCTTGVGYWATDQGTWNNGGAGGVFYKCTSTNTWGVLYTPYTYPHPLITNGFSSGSGSGVNQTANCTETVTTSAAASTQRSLNKGVSETLTTTASISGTNGHQNVFACHPPS